MNRIPATRNVLFVVPNRTFGQEYLSYKNGQKKEKDILASALSNPVVPYGVLSIASYIKKFLKSAIKIKMIDFNVEALDFGQIERKTIDIMESFDPDVVGISALFSSTYDSIKYFCDIIKSYNPGIVTVAGGACATNEYNELLTETMTLDAVCYAEGEIPFLNLVDSKNLYDALETHNSFVTRKSIHDGRRPQASFIGNLDEIPFIDYHLCEIRLYKQAMDNNTFKHDKPLKGESIYLPVHTTRGCPFNCVFCAAASVHGKKMRYMSEEFVIKNIEHMVEKFGLTHLTIEDDQFLLDKKRAKKILQGILNLRKKISICTLFVTASFIDDEIVILLKKLGVKEIPLAIEHGSDYMLKKVIDKPFSTDDIKRAVATIKKHDLAVTCGLVIGLPGEREEDREETVRLIKEIGVDWTTFSIATPFKGSRLYDLCTEHGYIKKEDLKNADLRHAIIHTETLDPEYITKKSYMMNLELNFVDNYRMGKRDYKTAAFLFEGVVKKYPLHAFAHYYLAKAYEGMNEHKERIGKHRKKFEEIVASNSQWRQIAIHFNLC